MWELNEPENAGFVATREFDSIKAKRPVNWELVGNLRFVGDSNNKVSGLVVNSGRVPNLRLDLSSKASGTLP